MEYAFGADEAGRGPALGSMFVAAVAVDDAAAIPDGVDDSKRLSASRRESLADRLRDDDRVAVGVAEVTPARIDDAGTNMNELTVAAHADAVARVDADGDRCVCDAGDTDADRFGRRVEDRCDAGVEVVAEHGADGSDDLVAAASIIAKSARERHVERLSADFGDVGSGYPSDPTTRSFLRGYVDTHESLPDCARRSWSTCEDLLASLEQAALEEF